MENPSEPNTTNSNTITPTFADSGRQERCELSIWAETYLFQHCRLIGAEFKQLAEDRLSTREACQKPDIKVNLTPVELKTWSRWITGRFSDAHPTKPLQLNISKKMLREWPDAIGMMVNLDGSWTAWVPFLKKPDRWVKTPCHSSASGWQWAAQWDSYNEYPLRQLPPHPKLIEYQHKQKELGKKLMN